MFIRPKDYISVNDKLFFAVVSEYHEGDCALTWLRYVKSEQGLNKLNTEEAEKFIDIHFPAFNFHSTYADIKLHGIPYDSISEVLRPDQTIPKLLKLNSPDRIQKDAIAVINLLLDAGIKIETIGITGSLMLNTQNEQSDIDMIVYGRNTFFKVRDLIKYNIEVGKLKSLDELNWQEAYQRRDCALSFEEYKSHEIRKYNKCISGTTKVDISMIPENYERIQEAGSCKKLGKTKIISTVIDDAHSYDFPARYIINTDDLKEVVSYTATYTGQAMAGEKIEAVGYIEQDNNGDKRLLVGSSREAAGEYIRVVK